MSKTQLQRNQEYKERNNVKGISASFNLSKDDERTAYEIWQDLPNKKQVLIDLLLQYDNERFEK
ncbi:hypothetical protein B0181_04975 [Moraxella caviae]|uniref:Uncharacterized protein n=1 Tax=Moraxella caviae TaxID=34060 RepID=A0A1T0A3D7_9GAMM|nr:hypothetical protein [Moraxella caviae]OOR90227.1 hypothetical protein B0181_04975 [Moraxella caviae]STZ14552.1 Uncharacterised protein [Moraxella caviae]VEW12557.1 Uncharacterised protein [Moraxella caviae]